MATRYFVSELAANGTGWRAGNRKGYATEREAVAVAERLGTKSGALHSVDLYEVYPDGERDHVETVGYFPEERE